MDDINKGRETRFTEPEVRSALARMQDDNQVMVADDIIFLIWGDRFWNWLHGLWKKRWFRLDCTYWTAHLYSCILIFTSRSLKMQFKKKKAARPLTSKLQSHSWSTNKTSKQCIFMVDLDPLWCRFLHQFVRSVQKVKSFMHLCSVVVMLLYYVHITVYPQTTVGVI